LQGEVLLVNSQGIQRGSIARSDSAIALSRARVDSARFALSDLGRLFSIPLKRTQTGGRLSFQSAMLSE
jgi:hypothetical protein